MKMIPPPKGTKREAERTTRREGIDHFPPKSEISPQDWYVSLPGVESRFGRAPAQEIIATQPRPDAKKDAKSEFANSGSGERTIQNCSRENCVQEADDRATGDECCEIEERAKARESAGPGFKACCGVAAVGCASRGAWFPLGFRMIVALTDNTRSGFA